MFTSMFFKLCSEIQMCIMQNIRERPFKGPCCLSTASILYLSSPQTYPVVPGNAGTSSGGRAHAATSAENVCPLATSVAASLPFLQLSSVSFLQQAFPASLTSQGTPQGTPSPGSSHDTWFHIPLPCPYHTCNFMFGYLMIVSPTGMNAP